MKSFKGLNGTIILRDSGVAIVRENMVGTTFHNGGEVEIPYSNVSEVEVVPGALLNGFICIVENCYGSPSNVFSAMMYENTIIFRLTRNGQAKKMKRLIEERL